MHTRTLRSALAAGADGRAGSLSRGAERDARSPAPGAPAARGTGRPRPSGTPPAAGKPAVSPNGYRTFMDLVASGAIAVTASGVSLGQVRMAIENRESGRVSFVIPIGTFLDAGAAAFQSMLTTHDHPVSIGPRRVLTEHVLAACANRNRTVPRAADTFLGVRDAPDPRLAATLRNLDAVGASDGARQTAVWIMTDDEGWGGYGHDDAAVALWALDLNGVDVTATAIWQKTPGILAGVRDPFLKAWLGARC